MGFRPERDLWRKGLRRNLFPARDRFGIVGNLVDRCSAKKKYRSRPGTRYGTPILRVFFARNASTEPFLRGG